jgi:citronellol/citronellal dehydrogenase
LSAPSRFESIFAANALKGQTVFITGGGTGIGRCIAHEVAALGGTSVIGGRRIEPLESTVAEIVEAGGRADFVKVNVRDADEVAAVVDTIVQRHGRIDGLVNSAGGQFTSRADEISPNGWRSVVDLNLTGTFLVCREVFLGSMHEHGGSIVSIVADVRNGMPSRAHSGAARAGVMNLAKTLAIEWAPSEVRVNTIAPGPIYSTVFEEFSTERAGETVERLRRTPAGRIGTESEVSAAAVFLLSPAAAFMTGQTLYVDGGGSLTPETMPSLPTGLATKPFNGFHLARSEKPLLWTEQHDPANE